MTCRLPRGFPTVVMCHLIFAFAAIAAAASLAQEPTAGPEIDAARLPQATTDWQSGWIQLFDQATMFGWRGLKEQAVQNGQMIVRGGDTSRTSAQFSEFTLHVKYRLEPNSEAALLLLANPRSRDAGVDHVSLRLLPEQRQLFVVVTREIPAASKVVVKYVFTDENGQLVGEPQSQETSLGRGYLGFRVTTGSLQIEQVSLLPTLPATERYATLDANGGFDQRGVGDAKVAADAGMITLRGGPGYLATQERYSDFVLSIDARASANTNSGVFFRCIPGEDLNGYESQIHNGFVDGDRAQPEDCGTGGIFRRVNARRVVADHDQWFRKVIMVCGGQISVWVNGDQVTDWSDQRPPNENPRRGRRLEAGTVMLQAHDPGTHVDFRNLRILELPPR